MTDDERDMAVGRLIRLRAETEQDLKTAQCDAAQHLRTLRKWIAWFEAEGDGVERPMSSPSHEELEATARALRDTKKRLANLELGIIDGC
ncbi:MAG: hypothetical protein OXM58_19590 [Rhodospirillaceae bacterium]|nr:hypothetical protein [Rhodospirillaceae bacterium]MDE0617921.1 hypothetical protein [Rhodospirillaceae bacterium]